MGLVRTAGFIELSSQVCLDQAAYRPSVKAKHNVGSLALEELVDSGRKAVKRAHNANVPIST